MFDAIEASYSYDHTLIGPSYNLDLANRSGRM